MRERRDGTTVFYTLEAHDLDIQEIARSNEKTPDAETSGGGLARAALPGHAPTVKFSAFFEKFKPIHDLLGLKYKEIYPNVR